MSGAAMDGETHEPEIHKSTIDRLIYMANQISLFFESQGSEKLAEAGTADHIRSFWDPSMLRRIFAHLEETGGEGLRPIALGAVTLVHDAKRGAVRARLEAAGMHSGREPGDDAG